jgi:hypothetical protein
MRNADPRLEQIDSLWVDGVQIMFMAAGLNRSDELGRSAWQMLVFQPSPTIIGNDLAIRVRVRDGETYASRAMVEISIAKPRPGGLPSVLLRGTQPLAVLYQA